MGVLAQKWIKVKKTEKQKDKYCQEMPKIEKALDDTIQTSSDRLLSD